MTDLGDIEILWLVVAAALVLLMQPGFACLEIGQVRAKNTVNIAIKNLTDFALAACLFWLVGFGLMFGASWYGVTGTSHFLPSGHDQGSLLAFFAFQLMFCGASATIVSGAAAERMKFTGYLFVTALVAAVIYPLVGHWVWGGGLTGESEGWLARLGFVDFAGGLVVHSVGGWVALAAILVIGARAGRFGPGGAKFEPNDLATSAVGALLLLVGWLGFNAGSVIRFDAAVPLIVVNTLLAAGAGALTSVLISRIRGRHADAMVAVNGLLAGLVAVTAGCGYVDIWAALLIGAIGAMAAFYSEALLERFRIDDVVKAVPTHLVAGTWGLLALALFGDLELIGTGHDRLTQLGLQAFGVCCVGVAVFGASYLALSAAHALFGLRVPPAEEEIGQNLAEHGAGSSLLNLMTEMEFQRRSGNFDRLVTVEPYSDVAPVAAQYNRVLQRVQTEHGLKEEALREKADALDAARVSNDVKTEFLANINHELRTPLNAIIGFSEILAREKGGTPKQDRNRDYAQVVLDSGRHLLEIVNQILEMSQMGARHYTENESAVGLAALLSEVVAERQASAEQKGLELSADVRLSDVLLRCEVTAIKRAFRNVIENGLKFTPAGSVTLSAEIEPDGDVLVRIADTGVGVAPENLERILRPFVQIGDVYSSKPEGVGLGLSMAHSILRLHQGSLTVDSRPGRGTTVTLRLPAARIEEAQAA